MTKGEKTEWVKPAVSVIKNETFSEQYWNVPLRVQDTLHQVEDRSRDLVTDDNLQLLQSGRQRFVVPILVRSYLRCYKPSEPEQQP